jgi:hypothetical protein
MQGPSRCKIRRPLSMMGFLLSVIGFVVGCDDNENGSLSQRICERADECNFLPSGVSAQDCSDARQMCVDALLTSERRDWEAEIRRCLELESCINFDDCYQGVPEC